MNNKNDPKYDKKLLALLEVIADQKLEINGLEERVGIIYRLRDERDALQEKLDAKNNVSGR